MTLDEIANAFTPIWSKENVLWDELAKLREQRKLLEEACAALGHRPRVTLKKEWELRISCEVCHSCLSSVIGHGAWDQLTDEECIAELRMERMA